MDFGSSCQDQVLNYPEGLCQPKRRKLEALSISEERGDNSMKTFNFHWESLSHSEKCKLLASNT